MIDHAKLAQLRKEMDDAYVKLVTTTNNLMDEGESSPGFTDVKMSDEVFDLNQDYLKKHNAWVNYAREHFKEVREKLIKEILGFVNSNSDSDILNTLNNLSMDALTRILNHLNVSGNCFLTSLKFETPTEIRVKIEGTKYQLTLWCNPY